MPEHQEDQEQGKAFEAQPPEAALAALGGGEQPVALTAAGPEAKQPIEASNIEGLRRQATELQGMAKVQQGLEQNIVGGGLQEMADRYGGHRLLAAMTTKGPTSPTTMGELRGML